MAAPVLLLGSQDDPHIRRFHEAAKSRGIEIWRPFSLDDIAWSVDPLGAGDVTLVDLRRDESWNSAQLAGVWFQALPPPSRSSFGSTRSDAYVLAEIHASWACLGRQLACPCFGLPVIDEVAVGAGIPTRVELRRLGLGVLRDVLVPGSTKLLLSSETHRLWVTTWLKPPDWASNLPPADPSLLAVSWATTLLDDRRILAVIRVDQCTKVVEVDGDEWRIVSPEERGGPLELSRELAFRSDARLGVTLFARQGGQWAFARHLMQMPYWLSEIVDDWLHSRLLEVFVPHG